MDLAICRIRSIMNQIWGIIEKSVHRSSERELADCNNADLLHFLHGEIAKQVYAAD